MTRVVSLGASLLVVLAFVSGPSAAAAPCQEREIRVDVQPTRLGAGPSAFDVVDAVVASMRNDLGLKLPAWRKAYVCRDEETLSEALLRNFGAKVWDRSVSTSVGLATPIGILFRGDYLAGVSLARRVAVIAHELAHLSQQELAGPRVHELPLWIAERHAEWVAFRVADRLGYGAFSVQRAEATFPISLLAIPHTLLPGLDALDSHERWQRSTLGLGHAATYGQAFLAVDRLTEQYGSAKVVEFLRAFASVADFSERWSREFPISYQQFIDDFRAYVRGLGPGDAPRHTQS